MAWISLLAAFLLASAFAFGGFLLASIHRIRKDGEIGSLLLSSLLPGHDCGLCGYTDCRAYAEILMEGRGDPGLCAPGGAATEARIREAMVESGALPGTTAFRALVRCGGRRGKGLDEYPYAGRADCASAVRFSGGPKRCKVACLGFGSCASACPLGAIRISGGLARVLPELCTGCGACIELCPTKVIALVPREPEWYVACVSHADCEEKKGYCSAACTACGTCSRLSRDGEFVQEGELAYASFSVPSGGGAWAEIAESCPVDAIVRAGNEKKR